MRPPAVRFLRTEAAMAYPAGRLLAVRDSAGYVLTAEGWSRLSATIPATAEALTRQDAGEWAARQGWDPALLDAVPSEVG